ncbi:hypothetical protein GCM10023152_36580 [Agromyces bauzanensis]|uniref:Uncharacterized protein n=1 Tax=Agromyces bauzanensis TaxID=1308924 RepID=A0A917PKQ8_9MICO|nr:hypothetical protein GCM10011372_21820 [Agromyces bauzanensis]
MLTVLRVTWFYVGADIPELIEVRDEQSDASLNARTHAQGVGSSKWRVIRVSGIATNDNVTHS